MKKAILLFVQICAVFTYAHAQIPYSFAAAPGVYTPLAGGTQATFTEANNPFNVHILAEGFANNIPIGFTFNYNQTDYTQTHINVNGFASFVPFQRIFQTGNNDYSAPSLTNALVIPINPSPSTATIRPIIAPLWDDLEFEHSGSGTNVTSDITYLTEGSAPNRIFTIEWKNAYWDATADPDPYDGSVSGPRQISFQLKLYETTNQIQFVYQQESGSLSNANALIGITTENTGNNSYISVDAAGTIDSTQEFQITTKPADDQVFTFTPTYVLPVRMKDFTIAKQNTSNQLHWSTLSEANNKGFQVQRSSDGIYFSNIAFVGSKASNGNSSALLNYEYRDAQPLAGKNYYRLQQVDNDGKFTYSVVSMMDNTRGLTLSIQKLSPNPAQQELTLVVESPENERAAVAITNMNGKLVKQQTIQLVKGTNVVKLNVADIAASVYTIKLSTNETFVTQQFVKE